MVRVRPVASAPTVPLRHRLPSRGRAQAPLAARGHARGRRARGAEPESRGSARIVARARARAPRARARPASQARRVRDARHRGGADARRGAGFVSAALHRLLAPAQGAPGVRSRPQGVAARTEAAMKPPQLEPLSAETERLLAQERPLVREPDELRARAMARARAAWRGMSAPPARSVFRRRVGLLMAAALVM